MNHDGVCERILSKLEWPSEFIVPEPNSVESEWVDVFDKLFPGQKELMQATPQDSVHHAEGDVWTHTKMVTQCLLDDPEYDELSVAERGVVFYAALLHDISKPSTTKEMYGRIVAPGHSKKGAIESRVLLWEHGVNFHLREQVSRLIEVHQVPFFAFNSREGVHPDFTARKLSMDRSLKLLCLLARADMRGRVCDDMQNVLDNIELFRELAIELDCLDKPYAFPDNDTRMAYLRSSGERYPDQPIFVESPFEVVMLSGLPATGKSTWAERYGNGMSVIGFDDVRADLGISHGESTGKVIHLVDDMMREKLRKKESFILNGTHLSRQMRERALGLISDYGGRVKVVYFEAPLKDLIARNESRDSSLPSKKIKDMAWRWEVPGLDEVDSVEFLVEGPWLKKDKKNRL